MATVVKAPVADPRLVASSEIVPVYVWEWPVRIAHWMIVLSLVVLTVTGAYMHRPFLVATSSRAWVMGTARFVHELFGFILIAVLILRFYWFFAGNRWARWRAWIPLRRDQWLSISSMLRYYTYRKREPDPEVGHNSLAAATYTVIMFLLVVECVSGVVLYSVVRGSHTLTLLVGWISRIVDIQYIRAIHYFIMFLFMAFVIHHVYSAFLVSKERQSGLMESIFTGWKFVSRQVMEEDAANESREQERTSGKRRSRG